MDNIILEAIVREWNTTLRGAGIGRIYYYRDRGYYLSLFKTSSGFMHLKTDAPLMGCRILSDRPAYPSESNNLLLMIRKHIEGGYINKITKPDLERIIELHIDKVRQSTVHTYRLILEITGNTRNLFLLDGEANILSLDKSIHFKRNLKPGSIYTYPQKPDAESLNTITRDKFEKILNGHTSNVKQIESLILRGIFGLGKIPSREVALQVEKSPQLGWQKLEEILNRKKSAFYEPILYTGPASNDPTISIEYYFHVIGALHLAEGMEYEKFSTVSEGLTKYYEKNINQIELVSIIKRTSDLLVREEKSCKKLIEKLSEDLTEFENYEQYKINGDLLISNINTAVKKGNLVTVINHFDPEQAEIVIKIDPSFSIKDNAEQYYKKYKKAKRGKETVKRRIEDTEKKLSTIQQLQKRIKNGEKEDLQNIEKELYDYKILRRGILQKRRSGKKQQKRLPYRLFISSDGIEILVGKDSKDNDDLTFHYAKDNDFWMHAAGSPGSHVVVRNNSRLQKCPPATLAEAAALAAYYSKQRTGLKVTVHHSQKKYVKKLKGVEPGKVRLLAFNSIVVNPEMPSSVKHEDDHGEEIK